MGHPATVIQQRVLTLPVPTFVPVDAQAHFVLLCEYTGKEVVG